MLVIDDRHDQEQFGATGAITLPINVTRFRKEPSGWTAVCSCTNMELGCSLVHLADACDKAVSERWFAGEKELEGLGKTTAVSVCDLSDPCAH